MKIAGIPLSYFVLSHPWGHNPPRPRWHPAPPVADAAAVPSHTVPRDTNRRALIPEPRTAAGSGKAREITEISGPMPQQEPKQEPRLHPIVIRNTLGSASDRISELENNKGRWSSMTAELMNESNGDDALSTHFRRFTTTIGATLAALRDKNGPDGQKAYLSIWSNPEDRAAFVQLATQLDQLFRRPIGTHVRDRADKEDNRTKPVIVRDLADRSGYQSSKSFTDEDIRQVADLHDELAELFPIYRDLMSRAKMPEIPNTTSIAGPSHATRNRGQGTRATNAAVENTGCLHFSSASRLIARLGISIQGRSRDS